MAALTTRRITRAFQTSVSLNIKSNVHSAVWYNGGIMYRWAKNLFADLNLPDDICTISRNRLGYRVETIYDGDNNYFCMQVEHPDRTVAGRVWTVDAEIISEGEQAMLGTRVLYSTPSDLEDVEIPRITVPGFVRTIALKNGLYDVCPIKKFPNDVSSEDDVISLCDLIGSKERKLPVVIISERPELPNEYTAYTSGYLVDTEMIANKLFLLAHVFCIPVEYQEYLRHITGDNWNVFGGAIRTYFPKVDFDEENYLSHPLSLPETILASTYSNAETGEEYIAGDAYTHLLSQKLLRSNARQRLNWQELGHKYLHVARREQLLNQKRERLEGEDLRKLYEEVIKEYEKQIAEQKEAVAEAEEQAENYKMQLDDANAKIYWQNNRIINMEEKLREIGNAPDTEKPDSYEGIEEWVRNNYSGRIVLHPRAIRALKEAVYEDIGLVCQCIDLLGTDYYKMKTTGEVTKDDFQQKCRELTVEEDGAVTEISAGTLGDVYYVTYNGQKKKIDRHLKKGTSRDPRNCMRIYFFWDDDANTTVICSLPQHLQTRSS